MKILFQKYRNPGILKYFMIGFLFAPTIHIGLSCSKESSTEPEPNPSPNTDMEVKINEGALAIENAFLSGDPNQVNNIFTENALSIYGTDILNVPSQELVEFGEALKSRELNVFGDTYAEYNYTFKGITYSIGLAQQGDGTWKLMRL